MYPGRNNYNPGYPSSQSGYNAAQQPPGFQSGGPPIGFNVTGGMNQGTGYGSQPGYNPYPSNAAPYMPTQQNYAQQGYNAPQQGYNAPQQGYNASQQGYNAPQQGFNAPRPQGYNTSQQGYVPQGQYIAGQPGSQHSQNQYPPPQQQGYAQILEKRPQQNVVGYEGTYNPVNPMQTPSQNPSFTPINLPNASHQVIMDSIGSGGETYRGTIKPYSNFNAEQDSNVLKKAMKGLGTDEKAIIECLGRRNLAQRLEIKKTFKTMFGKDLLHELKSELSGNFSRAVIESLYDSDYFDAYSLHKAMEGAGTREDVLTEILTSRSNQQINNIKEIYKKMFNKDLEKEVMSETSGFYKRVLVSCLQACKKELTPDEIMRLRQQGPIAIVNINLAKQEAQELYNAGEKKIGTDEACFIKIFASRNKYQLRATFEEYKKVSAREILSSIEREMSGDLASALKAIALQAIDPALYFATRLYRSMKGAGTNDTALIRILLTRSEIDLENIKVEFHKQYQKTLESFVIGDTSGDYQKYLMRFVEGN